MIFLFQLATLWVFVYGVSATPIEKTHIEKILNPVSRNDAGRYSKYYNKKIPKICNYEFHKLLDN